MPVPTPPAWTNYYGTYGTRSTANTASWTITGSIWMNGTYTATGSLTSLSIWNPVSKVKNGKYRVRCRSCAQWAKVIEEKGSTLMVNCKRCLGENVGFIA